MTTSDFPQIGDLAVELTEATRSHERSRISETMTILRFTDTMVITTGGRKYNRVWLGPINEGRYSNRRLVSVTDPRVLVVKGLEHLAEVALAADNLARIDYAKPEDIAAALARISMTAGLARHAVIDLMAGASRAEQESPR